MPRTAVIVLAVLTLAACGREEQPVAPYVPARSNDLLKKTETGASTGSATATAKDAVDHDDAGVSVPVGTGSDGGSSLDPATEDDGPVPDGWTESGSDDPAGGAADGCNGIDESSGQVEIVNENLTAAPIVSKGSKKVFGPFAQDYAVTVLPTLALRATGDASVMNLQIAATAMPEKAGKEAAIAAKAASGVVTTEMVPLAGRAAALAKAKGWDGIVCTVQPARKITVQTGGANVQVQFEPALPQTLSPRALKDRFAAELSADRTFTGITATVISSDVASVPAGSQLAGVVTVKRISPALGAAFGDVAYEIVADFGGPDITNALGVKPSTKFFIDTRRHRFTAIVTDTLMPASEGAPSQTIFLVP